jgi:Schlafen, AlbA_2
MASYQPIVSPADLHRLVIGTTREDHWLDFKEALDSENRENARDIAQFCNADGGVLVLGAREADHILTGFSNVQNAPMVIGRIERLVGSNLTPVPTIEPVVLEVAVGLRIIVVNVPPSLPLVARHDRQREFEFLVRGHESKRWMTLSEVDARMQNNERAMRLRLGRIPAGAKVGLDASLRKALGHNDCRVVGVTDDVVRLKKDGEELAAPLAYVEAVYQAGEPEAERIIRLSCCIAKHWQTNKLHLTRSVPSGTIAETFRARGLGE